jgi:ankyrin repeat protein
MVTRRRKTIKRFKKPTTSDMFLDYVATGRDDLIEDYLDKGGDVKVRNCKGETALHIAVAHNQNDILARLLPYFNEDELDIRDMYGLPVHITAIKYGNDRGSKLISDYYKSIKTKSYRFKNYNFKNSIRKATKKNNFKNIIKQLSESNKNPVIYPNQNREIINMWSYIPTRPNRNKSPFALSYNNKNTKKIVVNNKKKTRRTKKKPVYYITKNNTNSHF